MLSRGESDELWQLIGAYADTVINRLVPYASTGPAERMKAELEAVRRLARWIDLHTEDDR